jgi:hypothetical protein
MADNEKISKVCRTTGQTITTPCNKHYCIYFNKKSRLHCMNADWQDPVEIFELMNLPPQDVKKVYRDAEQKIAMWGRLINSIDRIKPQSFTEYVAKIFDRDNALAGKIAGNPLLFIPEPMRYIKPDMWVGCVKKWRDELIEAEIATPYNIDMWTRLENINLL